MNIIYCFDDNYKEMASISAKSYKLYHPDAKFYFIRKDEQNLLSEFTEELCGYKHITKSCFLRLLIPKLFPTLKRALYVDCDTLCKGDISEFYNTDFENNYLVGVRGHSYSDIQAKELGLPYYINSGVLLFNIPLMNKENYLEQIKENWKGALGKVSTFSADETIINWVFHNKIKLAPEQYNYSVDRDYGDRVCIKPKILHIIGSDKRKMYESNSSYLS